MRTTSFWQTDLLNQNPINFCQSLPSKPFPRRIDNMHGYEIVYFCEYIRAHAMYDFVQGEHTIVDVKMTQRNTKPERNREKASNKSNQLKTFHN